MSGIKLVWSRQRVLRMIKPSCRCVVARYPLILKGSHLGHVEEVVRMMRGASRDGTHAGRPDSRTILLVKARTHRTWSTTRARGNLLAISSIRLS